MEIRKFSEKQKKSILWWKEQNTKEHDGIICDGSVRSGKTLSMSVGFLVWAMSCFSSRSFAICGKTITSVRRNIVSVMLPVFRSMGFICEEKVSKNYVDVRSYDRENRFYLFGGKDEASASLIQGMTLSGVFLDEVALMPRSFVEQAVARCSEKGSKLWFNCNPDNPAHWFYNEWIKKHEKKNMLYLHFTMEDNPSLSGRIKARYEKLYSGVFYDRFIKGEWCAPSGIVYPMFDSKIHLFKNAPLCERFIVSCDYGTVNPSSFGLWGYYNGVWYRLKEYYYSSKREGFLRTDEEHYKGLEELCDGYSIECIIADPSAASFMECIRRHGRFLVRPADNNVISGIRRVSDALKQKKIMFSEDCKDSIREFSLYVFDEKAGSDCPVKENDHAMDDIRYFVSYAFKDSTDSFYVASMGR